MARRVSVYLSASITMLLICMAVLGPSIAPYSPSFAQPLRQFASPGPDHWLGLDGLGRDTWSRVLWGAQSTLAGAAVATLIAMGIGLVVGGIAGLGGGWIDQVVVHILDLFLAIPGLILALIFVALLGAGYLQVALAVGFSFIPSASRLIRASVLTIRSQQYVAISYALGADLWWVAHRHVLRNILGTILAYMAVIFAWALLNGAALDFLGLSGDLAVPTWGRMMNEGRAYLREAPLAVLAPGAAIMLAVLCVMGLTDEWRRQWLRLGR